MELAARTFFRIPVIGWLVSDAVHGRPDAKYYFIANVFVGFAALVYVFGYPFLIAYALTATFAMLIFLVVLTASDLFGRKTRYAKPAQPQGRSTRA